MSVCTSFWNSSATSGQIFMKFDIWVFFEHLSRKFKVSLKSDKSNGQFVWRPMYIYDNISQNSSQKYKCFSRNILEKVKTHILCSVIFFCRKSYHYEISFFLLWRCGPTRVMASSFTRFLDHTQRRTTVGRTPPDEWLARRRDLYLTTHNTHNRQTSMPLVGFEPTISAGERLQIYALDRAATGIGTIMRKCGKKYGKAR